MKRPRQALRPAAVELPTKQIEEGCARIHRLHVEGAVALAHRRSGTPEEVGDEGPCPGKDPTPHPPAQTPGRT